MADSFSTTDRSRIMRAVKGQDTSPEREVAVILQKLGVKARRHVAQLPGRPDFVVPKARVVIFVHGCFWHWHGAKGCTRGRRMPATRRAYWEAKIAGNRRRDRRNRAALRAAGWRVVVVWECALKRRDGRVARRLERICLGD